MKRNWPLMTALGLGAGLMFFLDPAQGPGRRRLLMERLAAGRGTPSDETLHDRLRSRIGRWSSHPRAIGVSVTGGDVTVAGPILASEAERLLRGLRMVRGVKTLENHLDLHAIADIPELLTRDLPRHGPLAFLRGAGTHSERLAAGLVGGALTAWGLRRRDAGGLRLSLLGLGILARSLGARSPAGA